jgi:hypothetical protein
MKDGANWQIRRSLPRLDEEGVITKYRLPLSLTRFARHLLLLWDGGMVGWEGI